MAWGNETAKQIQLEIATTGSSVKKGFTEITLAGAVVGSFILSEFEQNGQWGLWLTEEGAKTGSQQVASVDHAGVVTFSDANLIKELSVEEIAYSASFVLEKPVNVTPTEPSAGPAENELRQFDKYFYFQSKVGVEGPTEILCQCSARIGIWQKWTIGVSRRPG